MPPEAVPPEALPPEALPPEAVPPDPGDEPPEGAIERAEPPSRAERAQHADPARRARPADRAAASPPPNRRGYLLLAVSLLAVGVAAVIFAANTDPSKLQPKIDISNLPLGPPAPAVHPVGWINSPPLTPASLTGKVVLYDFWTYSCVNCVRTIPYLRSWYARYAADGLVVIGVHTPEFDFEHNHTNVVRAVQNLGVTWPVALDDNMTVWNAFQNDSWPADYIADSSGHLRYEHVGEGAYDQTEDVIRNLLGVAASSPRATPPKAPDSGATSTADVTPETYLGDLRNDEAKQGPASYADPALAVPVDTVKLSGEWTGTAEYVQAGNATSALVLHYQAREVNLVLAPPASGPVDIVVELDGKPVPPTYRPSDMVVNAAGQTTVPVADPDLYTLVLGPAVEGHVVRVTAGAPGLLAYDYTFGQ